jgi:hypothetical protein
MNTREIKVCIEKEPALYNELFSAMVECREYDGCHVLQYSEYCNGEGWMIGEFMLREAGDCL